LQVFQGEIPASWIVGTGEYSISWLEQTTQTKELPPQQLVTFKVVESSNLYLIVGSCAAIVLGCLLMALLILVYRNQDRAKELVISFIQFEMRALAEAFLEALDIIGKPVLLLLSRLRSTGSVRSGDALCFSALLSARYKPWAEKLLPPYSVFFGLGCVASLISILSHTSFFVDKLRSRSIGATAKTPMSPEELRMKDALDHNRCVQAQHLITITHARARTDTQTHGGALRRTKMQNLPAVPGMRRGKCTCTCSSGC
jgi:hypothetical protein